MKKIIQITLILFLALSCNKEKRYSKKLIKGETWSVESITVDGSSLNSGSTWSVKGDDIYESVSKVQWDPTSTNSTTFEWQFLNKKHAPEEWVLNYIQDTAECQGPFLDELDYLAYDISGTYEVIKHKKTEMLFRSSATNKYAGQVVEIKVKR